MLIQPILMNLNYVSLNFLLMAFFFSVIAVVVLYHVFMCAGFFSTFSSLYSELMGQDVDSLSLYSKSLAYSRHLK